jgi:ribulose 1,5-bisphosphate carboxylase large subunit-like protein
MRLIDADELIKVLHESLDGDVELIKDYELLGIDDFINAQPTAYNVDKVIKEIESCFNATEGKGRRLAYHRAITIVKGGINGLN